MNWVTTWFEGLLANIINGLLSSMVAVVKSVELVPYHMNALPGYQSLYITIQGVAFAWLVLVTTKEFIMNNVELLGDQAVNPMAIAKNFFISAILIIISPLLITDMILPLMQYLSDMVTASGSIGGISSLADSMQKTLTLTPGKALLTLDELAMFNFWGATLIASIFLIIIIIVAITAGMRFVELFLLSFLGPILAVSKVGFGTSWDVWLREIIACAAGNTVQLFCLAISFNLFLNAGMMTRIAGVNPGPAVAFLAIGAGYFAVKGPDRLHRLIGGGGPTGFKALSSLAGAAKTVAM